MSFFPILWYMLIIAVCNITTVVNLREKKNEYKLNSRY